MFQRQLFYVTSMEFHYSLAQTWLGSVIVSRKRVAPGRAGQVCRVCSLCLLYLLCYKPGLGLAQTAIYQTNII